MPDVPDDASMGARVARRGIEFFITSRTLTIIGDMAALTALSVYIYTASGSATMVSGLFVVRVLPRLFGPIAGAVADRYNLRTLMVVCDLGACLLFVAIAIVQPSYWGLLAMILVAESIATIAMPGARTWVARRVPADARGRLNGVLTAGIAIGFGVGAGIGGATASGFGYRWALLINAASFVLSAALVTAAGSVPPAKTAGAQRPRLISSAVAGTRLIFSESRLSGVAVGLIGVAFAAAVDRPAVVALTQDDLPGGGGGYGLLQDASPAEHVGTVVAAVVSTSFIADGVGSLTGGRLVDALGPRVVFAIAAFLMACCAAYVAGATRPAATGPAVTLATTDTSVASGGGAGGDGEDR